jgi:transcriptional regulator with XRE-family HTH domain
MTASEHTAANHLVGANLRLVRERSRMSLHDVEVASGDKLKGVVVGSYERGDRAVTVARLLELAAFYGVPAASLLPGDGAGTSASEMAVALDQAADFLRRHAARLREGT